MNMTMRQRLVDADPFFVAVILALLLLSTAISFYALTGDVHWCIGFLGALVALASGTVLASIYTVRVTGHWRWTLALAGAVVSLVFAYITDTFSGKSNPVGAGMAFAVTVFGLWPASHLVHWRSTPQEPGQASAWFANLGTASMATIPALAVLGAGRVLIVAVPFVWTIAAFINRASERLVQASPSAPPPSPPISPPAVPPSRTSLASSPRLTKRGVAVITVACFALVLVPSFLALDILEPLYWIGCLLVVWVLALDLVSSTYRHRFTQRSGRELAAWLAALAVLIVAALGVRSLMPGVALGLVLALVFGLAVLGLSFVLRGHGFVALVALGCVVCWVSIDRTSPAHQVVRPEVDLLVLGDSYASGEGANSFVKGTNDRDRNECRRAPTAFGPVIGSLSSKTGDSLDVLSLACSGALTSQVDQVGQMRWVPRATGTGWRPQLDDTDGIDGTKYVLVSVGGNDMLFGAVAQSCALPGNCADAISSIDGEFFEGMQVKDDIVRVLEALVERFPKARIVLVPYPDVLGTDPDACSRLKDKPLETAEVIALQRFIGEIHAVQRAAADEVTSVRYLSSVEGAFGKEGVCGHREVLNLLSLSPVSGGSVIDRIDPTSMLHNSFHPTALGHQCVAKAIVKELDLVHDTTADTLCADIEQIKPSAGDLALTMMEDELNEGDAADRPGRLTCSDREECIYELQLRAKADARAEIMPLTGPAALIVICGMVLGLLVRVVLLGD